MQFCASTRSVSERRQGPCRLREIQPDQLGRAAADVEHEGGRSSRSISDAQPETASLASASRRTGLSISRPSSRWTRSRNTCAVAGDAAGFGRDEPRADDTRLASLIEHMCRASIVRVMAASERRPLTLTPSPSRMMREKASITRKSRRDGRATRSRQLLVPRSSAAYAGLPWSAAAWRWDLAACRTAVRGRFATIARQSGGPVPAARTPPAGATNLSSENRVTRIPWCLDRIHRHFATAVFRRDLDSVSCCGL